MKQLFRAIAFAVLATAASQPARAAITISGDPVLYWNKIMLDTLPASQAIRAYAMMNIAVYDSVNAASGYQSHTFLNGVSAPGGDTRAAAAQAAHDVLVAVNPGAAAQYDAALTDSLALVANGSAKTNGVLTGQAYAAASVASRANDGAFDPVTYTPSGLPGRYAPTPPGSTTLPIFPQWADVDPFILDSPSQFRAGPPPAIGSAAYATAFNEVKELGSAGSATRTADQTAAAQFWATANGSTYMRLALEASEDEGLSTLDSARLFARLGTGVADTLIALWDTKYYYDYWRPITAIRNADLDGNPLTIADPTWQSLIAAPAHPDYVSAHSALGAAVTSILLDTIGDEAFCATLAPAPQRCWSSLEAMSLDGALSRIYGGIHFRFDSEAGIAMGTQVAQFQRASGAFAAAPEPASWALMIAGFGLVGLALRRERRVRVKVAYA